MRTIVIYPGRFHPFHLGHKASYDYLANRFGANNVFVASSGKQAPITSPFTFSDKVAMMTKLGVPSSHIVQVVNPYQAQEITNQVDNKDDTILIFAVSEKDMQGPDARFKFGVKKNGEPSYIQPLPTDNKGLQPMSKHAYVMVTPTVNFQVQGKDANSASEIRKIYTAGNEADRNQIIHDLYGSVDKELRDIFDQRLEKTEEVRDLVAEARRTGTHTPKVIALLETVRQLEYAANLIEYEDLYEDYIDEKSYQGCKK